MKFQEAYDGWAKGRLIQAEIAPLLGELECSFRRRIRNAIKLMA